jgi:hypothetical protein
MLEDLRKKSSCIIALLNEKSLTAKIDKKGHQTTVKAVYKLSLETGLIKHVSYSLVTFSLTRCPS